MLIINFRHFKRFTRIVHSRHLWKKIIFEDNQKPIIFEVTIIISLFLELTNQISLGKIT